MIEDKRDLEPIPEHGNDFIADVRRSNLVWVVENINGDIIGVADSFAKALLIYEERYQDTPDRTEDRIHKFELNKFYYA